jgi:hypothetical protein
VVGMVQRGVSERDAAVIVAALHTENPTGAVCCRMGGREGGVFWPPAPLPPPPVLTPLPRAPLAPARNLLPYTTRCIQCSGRGNRGARPGGGGGGGGHGSL